MPTIDEQVEILMSGTGYGDEGTRKMMARELKERLIEAEKEGRPLRVYCGFDPTTSDLHLGHTIPMRKLRQFQELGHDVTFLIGSFTSLIGDPDGKNAREMLTAEKVQQNAETYTEQAFKILDRSKTRVRYNDEWLKDLNFLDVIKIAQNFTVQQFITRENFRNRIEAETPIYLHEFFYPLMQSYDAVAQDTDVQVGGQDQLFNLMAGRQLMSKMNMKPQIVIAMGESLPGTDGVEKMSKSKGNNIPLLTTPLDFFGKVMSIPDHAMGIYFKLLLGWNKDQLDTLAKDIASGAQHPRDVKARLGRDLLGVYHPQADPAAVQAEWDNIFKTSGTGLPEQMDELTVSAEAKIVDLLAEAKLVPSKKEARRQIEGGGVRLEGEKVADANQTITPDQLPAVLQVGKRNFVKLVAG